MLLPTLLSLSLQRSLIPGQFLSRGLPVTSLTQVGVAKTTSLQAQTYLLPPSSPTHLYLPVS